MEALIGKNIGPNAQYHIERLLGKQSGRRTFVAKDTKTQQSVVIKLVLFSPDFTWQDLKLFEREAETLQALQHPEIPKYLDYFEIDVSGGKGFALVQTYIEARSLQDWVDSGRTFSEVELKVIARSLLDILHYLHHRSPPVIHRDIKPSNILFQPERNKLFLVDFGSVQTAQSSGTITVVGTYGYMPPEQFGGRAVPASDLYSLGATLIYLATGQHPADLTQDDMQIAFESSSNLSTAFTRWLRRLTYPDMARRIRTVESAKEVLPSSQKQSATSVSSISPKLKNTPSAYAPETVATRYVVSAPVLPLKPIFKDFKVSASAHSLTVRCRSSRVLYPLAQNEAVKPRRQHSTAPLTNALLLFAGFWIALVSAILFNAAALVAIMAVMIATFGFYFPMLTAERQDRKEAILDFSYANESSRIQSFLSMRMVSTIAGGREDTLDDTALRFSDWEVRSLCVRSDFLIGNRLIINLSSTQDTNTTSASAESSQVQISGTHREIWWLQEHIRRWGKVSTSWAFQKSD